MSFRAKQGLIVALGAVALAAHRGDDVLSHLLTFGLGVTLAILLPTLLLRRRLTYFASEPIDNWLLALGLWLVALMGLGLAWNVVGRLTGLERPLETMPSLIFLTVLNLVLRTWPALPRSVTARTRPKPWTVREQLVIVGSGLFVAAATGGAIRLNNGADGDLALAALIGEGLLLIGALRLLPSLREGVVLWVLYCLGLGLLLSVSLRGWLVSGHDIQQEFFVFKRTLDAGYWSLADTHAAYNACLSITLLPTVLTKVTGIAPLYVFKVLYQALFAVTPVLVYRIGRRTTTRPLALVGGVIFCAFPTFMADMPSMNRQEIAFILLGLMILLMVDRARAHAGSQRRHLLPLILVLGVGVAVAHYSTNYLQIAMFGLAWIAYNLLERLAAASSARRLKTGTGLVHGRAVLLTGGVIVGLITVTMLWTGPVNQSGGNVTRTAIGVVDQLRGQGVGRSSDVQYALFSGRSVSAQQRLDDYLAQAEVDSQGDRDKGRLMPVAETQRYPLLAQAQPLLPLTAAGATLTQAGVPVETVMKGTRLLAAATFQVLVLIGLLVVLLGRRRTRISTEFVALACAALALIAVQLVVPAFTIEYGLLRTFQQCLFLFSPLMAIGAAALLRPLPRRVTGVGLVALPVGLLVCLTGVIPQLFGGYPAQLNLNNAGQAHRLYYFNEQELPAMQYLADHAIVQPDGFVRPVTADRYSQMRLQSQVGLAAVDKLAPVLVPKETYVYLGSQAMQQSTVTVSYAGDKLSYQYPVEFLDNNLNLVHSSTHSRVYR